MRVFNIGQAKIEQQVGQKKSPRKRAASAGFWRSAPTD
jgi:hypothetical protein